MCSTHPNTSLWLFHTHNNTAHHIHTTLTHNKLSTHAHTTTQRITHTHTQQCYTVHHTHTRTVSPFRNQNGISISKSHWLTDNNKNMSSVYPSAHPTPTKQNVHVVHINNNHNTSHSSSSVEASPAITYTSLPHTFANKTPRKCRRLFREDVTVFRSYVVLWNFLIHFFYPVSLPVLLCVEGFHSARNRSLLGYNSVCVYANILLYTSLW